MKKKIIGITGPSAYSPKVRQMVEKHFKAIPLDIMQNGEEDLTRVASFCDAFILAGGVDIYPLSLEHEKRDVQRGKCYTKFDRSRDRREQALIDIIAKQGKKVFGICRGHQMLLSHRGLYLMPDISSSDVCHNPRDIEVDGEPIHFVEGYQNGIKEFFEQEVVNSFHHQAILYQGGEDAKHKGVEILALAQMDYEATNSEATFAIELARGDNFLSCQWHPELDYEDNQASRKVVDAFIKMIG